MKFGITQTFSCSYLPSEQEQLLVFAETEEDLSHRYGQLIQAGFRRSGEQIYRPHCPACQACQSIRIPVSAFAPSRSQKRILATNSAYSVQLVREPGDEYYPLYERYISERHFDGAMYPPSQRQYESFVTCAWKPPCYIEARDEAGTLIAVAVTDDVDDGHNHTAFSALYTFFAPELSDRSLGTWMILKQLELASKYNKQFLYLGYQVNGCQKMAYKSRFHPHERFLHNKWHRVLKNMP